MLHLHSKAPPDDYSCNPLIESIGSRGPQDANHLLWAAECSLLIIDHAQLNALHVFYKSLAAPRYLVWVSPILRLNVAGIACLPSDR